MASNTLTLKRRSLALLVAGLLISGAWEPAGTAQTTAPSYESSPAPSPGQERSPLPLLPSPSPSAAASAGPGEEEFANEGDLLQDYQVQPGDTLEVHLWGRDVELNYQAKVSLQGAIFVPRLGSLPVNGRSPEQVQRDLQGRVNRMVHGVQVAVLVRQVARIRVFVTGQVGRTGAYVVPGHTRLQELLTRAGGIIGNGSQRTIRLISREGRVRTVDLSRFQQQGELDDNPFVRAGDRVLVPFARRRVALTGEVVRPGVYEVLDKESLRDVLALAGGARPGAGLREATIWKGGLNSDMTRRQIVDLVPGGAGLDRTELLEDGDIVFLPANKNPVEAAVVFVYGSVGNPGSVPYRVGAHLSDYINMAGGPRQNADLTGTRITPASIAGKPSDSKVVDAYRIMYGGRFDLDPPLEVGTVVFVPERFFSFNNFADLAVVLNTTITLTTLVIGIINFTRGR